MCVGVTTLLSKIVGSWNSSCYTSEINVCACAGIDYEYLLMRLRKVHNGVFLVVTCVTLLPLWHVIFLKFRVDYQTSIVYKLKI